MSVQNVVVIGGGISGSIAAIALAQRGVDVTLVERSPQWTGVGHGITVQGNALAVLRRIGALDAVLERAHAFNGLEVCHADGHVLVDLETPRTGGPDLPATMGALRSDLQDVLVTMIHELGIETVLGTHMTSFDQDSDGVDVHLSNGTTLRTDLVVAADGIKSQTRSMLGITEEPAPTGMGIWRVVTKRSPDMQVSGVYYHGPHYKAGFTPISEDLCYAYVLTDPARPKSDRTDIEEMRSMLEGYHGHLDTVRDNLTEGQVINFQPIEWLFVDGPWHRGRVIAIGDAVHACPPLIAQGAAQCCEDALLLAEHVTGPEVRDAASLEEALSAFVQRRLPRVRVVVEASMQLVEWEIHPETPGADPAGLMGQSLSALTEEP